MIDIFHSRRLHYHYCDYYIRQNPKINIQNWVLNNKPDGCFYARFSNAVQQNGKDLNNIALFDSTHLTIETNDKVDELKKGCIVNFRNKFYMVDDVQRVPHEKEMEFNNEEEYTTFISLRK